MASGHEPVDDFLRYYASGPTHRLEMPSLLARATRNAVDGRVASSLTTLDLFVPRNSGEALLVELLYGWSLTESRHLTQAARHLDNALEIATKEGSESGLAMGMVFAATNSLASGRRDESFRLLNRAAAIAPTGSNQSLTALLVLAQILTVNRAPAAAEAVLLELWSARDWPLNAEAKINRRLARVRIELDKLEDASRLADRIGETAATDRDRVEHSILLAHLAAALEQPSIARAELDHATEIVSRINVPHLGGDFLQARVAVAVAEALVSSDEQSHRVVDDALEDVSLSHLTPRIQGMVIDLSTRRGDFESAWALSNEVIRTHLHEGVDMRGVFDLTIKLSDSHAESRFADELGSKHLKLQALETRSSAVLSALAHGVRDPLTVLQLWFGAEPDGSDNAGSSRLIAEAAIERVERLLEYVVWLARVDRFVAPSVEHSIDLERLAQLVIDQHQYWADFRDVAVIDRSPHQTVGGTDAADGVVALLSALVSHSTAYCAGGDVIELNLSVEHDLLHLAVIDSGPPVCPRVDRQSAASWEADLPMARVAGGDATGDLGLFLAESLADLFGASIEFDQLGDGRIRTTTILTIRDGFTMSEQVA